MKEKKNSIGRHFKTYDDLSFSDDFMFCKVMTDETLCKMIIRDILKIDVDKIEYLGKQQEINLDYDSRGIRMDVYVRDSDRVFNLEMQVRKERDMALRARYYQGLMDLDMLKESMDFKDLKETYIVFFCVRDPFDLNLPLYSLHTRCDQLLESKGPARIDDKTHKLIYNSSSWEKCSDPAVRSFLRYITTRNPDSELTERIDSAVAKAKGSENWRMEFMTLAMKYQEFFEIGKEEGIQEGISEKAAEVTVNFLRMGLSPVQVAQGTGLSVEEVEEIARGLESEP